MTVDATGLPTSGVYLYDPFGQIISSHTFGSGPTSLNNASDNPMAWAASPTRKTESLFTIPIIQMGARVYLPTLGRFLQVDPVDGGTDNAYSYVNDPVNASDYSGLGFWGNIVNIVTKAAKTAVKFAINITAAKVYSLPVVGKPIQAATKPFLDYLNGGNGSSKNTNINNYNYGSQSIKDFGVNPSDYRGSPGVYSVGPAPEMGIHSLVKVATPLDIPGKIAVGSSSLRTSGKLTITNSGWSYSGIITGYDHIDYRTEPGQKRVPWAQTLTDFGYALGQALGGASEYDMNMDGLIPLNESGRW